MFHCSNETGAAAWDAVANSAAMDFDGLDMVVAGIEPFSEVVLSKGSEPTLLGYKRQGILLSGNPDDVLADSTQGTNDTIVMSVANAPGLPPVTSITLVASDEEVHAPEGFELVQVQLGRTCLDYCLPLGAGLTAMLRAMLPLVALLCAAKLGHHSS